MHLLSFIDASLIWDSKSQIRFGRFYTHVEIFAKVLLWELFSPWYQMKWPKLVSNAICRQLTTHFLSFYLPKSCFRIQVLFSESKFSFSALISFFYIVIYNSKTRIGILNTKIWADRNYSFFSQAVVWKPIVLQILHLHTQIVLKSNKECAEQWNLHL